MFWIFLIFYISRINSIFGLCLVSNCKKSTLRLTPFSSNPQYFGNADFYISKILVYHEPIVMLLLLDKRKKLDQSKINN